MKLPTLTELTSSRQMIDAFGGYNHNLRIGDGEFFDMNNLTSDKYPVMSPRGKRGVYASPAGTSALIEKDTLCYIDGATVYYNGYAVTGLTISTAAADYPKQMISMGAYVIILPDKKYFNSKNLTDYGNIEATTTITATAQNPIDFEMCRVDGESYGQVTKSPTAPSNPNDEPMYWIDTSSKPHTLKQYAPSSGMWATIATTYIKISAPNIGAAFKQYDGVTISFSDIDDSRLADLQNTMPIYERGDGFIVVVGILDEAIQVTSGSITVARLMPKMDYITESENRLWGCRYGIANNGSVVNEIYACKQGDFKNWNCFMGISTDSYAASLGTDGQFTGAITHLGYPLFFKENCVHKIYGNYPANYQIITTQCKGVERGSNKSLAIVNNVLYYKGKNGICAYDGSLPEEISSQFGGVSYSSAVGCSHGNKYYVNMKDSGNNYYMFVYDTNKGLWHKEDGIQVDDFCSCRGELYYINHSDKKIKTICGSGTLETAPISWSAETGVIGVTSADKKYLSRLVVRMSLAIGTSVKFFVQYDSCGEWEHIFTMNGTNLRSFTVPIKPKRCDHMRLRIEGRGDAKIFSVTKTIEEGSDV